MNTLLNYPGAKLGMAKEIVAFNQNSAPRTEVLWCNFEVPGLFEMEGL